MPECWFLAVFFLPVFLLFYTLFFGRKLGSAGVIFSACFVSFIQVCCAVAAYVDEGDCLAREVSETGVSTRLVCVKDKSVPADSALLLALMTPNVRSHVRRPSRTASNCGNKASGMYALTSNTAIGFS